MISLYQVVWHSLHILQEDMVIQTWDIHPNSQVILLKPDMHHNNLAIRLNNQAIHLNNLAILPNNQVILLRLVTQPSHSLDIPLNNRDTLLSRQEDTLPNKQEDILPNKHMGLQFQDNNLTQDSHTVPLSRAMVLQPLLLGKAMLLPNLLLLLATTPLMQHTLDMVL